MFCHALTYFAFSPSSSLFLPLPQKKVPSLQENAIVSECCNILLQLGKRQHIAYLLGFIAFASESVAQIMYRSLATAGFENRDCLLQDEIKSWSDYANDQVIKKKY